MPNAAHSVRAVAAAIAFGALLAGCGAGDSAAAAAGPAPTASVPEALPVVGLLDGTSLVSFTTTDTAVKDQRPIAGLAGDTKIVGIDHRVKTGDLLGVGDQGGLYTIATGGAATSIGKLTVPLEGAVFGVDVNPAADALRIVSDTGQNLRQPLAMTPLAATAADTKLTNPATAPATGTVPAVGVTAAGYTNDDNAMASGTALFVIDTTADRVSLQSPANAGTLAPVGGLGGDAAPTVGFDVHSALAGDRAGALTAWASIDIGGTRSLHRIDLLTARVEKLGGLPGGVTDIALPLGK